MKEIELNNYKTQSLVVAIFCFVLATILITIAFATEIELSVSGADLDSDTSFILLLLIGLMPLLTGTNFIIKFLSIKKFDRFSIQLHTNKIIYPSSQTFKGFLKKEIPRQDIVEVRLMKIDANNQHIYLMNKNFQLIGYIESNILPHKTMNAQKLAQEINAWLVN